MTHANLCPSSGRPGAPAGPPPLAATAVVVTHNSARHVTEAVAPLLRAGLRVRVVDNNSTDHTVALLTERFPDVTVIANQRNAGFAAAVNQGLAGCTDDVLLVVNPDCVLPAPAARELVVHLRARPDVGIVGPRLVDAHGRPAISAHPFETLTSVVLSRFGGSLVPVAVRRLLAGVRRRAAYDACRVPSAPVSVDWLSGACLAIRRHLFDRIGGLDEGYFMYYEDEELCLQARRLGADVVLLPTATARHTGGGSSADPGWIWPHLYRSMLRFFARHRRSRYHALRLVILLRALLGVALAVVRLAVSPRPGLARLRAWTTITRLAATATKPPPEGSSGCMS
ncbi:glycosyltransferase family 2 protein [Micromonospora sp. WMMD1102]|uniref:glycosyltransferase family 2 protein n=1 Tax=Micromonospora sp. WMMD1102 TaxID=3016105 RepID=UPI0024154987|nr:glycosyltransferase family 2 protein [Micromonospora sp. WMMD1102]MDG4786342.1 glycosyltransferase family 2 protein [Micromonospora sp. WMMD1102]